MQSRKGTLYVIERDGLLFAICEIISYTLVRRIHTTPPWDIAILYQPNDDKTDYNFESHIKANKLK